MSAVQQSKIVRVRLMTAAVRLIKSTKRMRRACRTSRVYVRRRLTGSLMAYVQVEVFPEQGVICVRVDVESPAVKELVEAERSVQWGGRRRLGGERDTA